jgi:hypothetical protein
MRREYAKLKPEEKAEKSYRKWVRSYGLMKDGIRKLPLDDCSPKLQEILISSPPKEEKEEK